MQGWRYRLADIRVQAPHTLYQASGVPLSYSERRALRVGIFSAAEVSAVRRARAWREESHRARREDSLRPWRQLPQIVC